jgi:D-arginine dehydrogenase
MHEFDVIVIGAGIAGASVAAELVASARVLLLEQETQPGYHTTGRSAALYTTSYGPPLIRALSRASGGFLGDPRSRYLDQPLLRARGVMYLARSDQGAAMGALRAGLGDAVRLLDRDEMLAQVPLLRPDYAKSALFEVAAADIDVAALHQHYLRTFRAGGGQIRTNAGVTGLARDARGWRVGTRDSSHRAAVVVNAAGAWADVVAHMGGVAPVGLIPKRRTAALVALPDGVDVGGWPMVVDVDERFYVKPDAGKLLISPGDATPSPPCDAQPEEIDVAICADRIETAFDLRIRRIDHKWAGLRSFVSDGCPVAGFDPQAPGFFWLAGQGGYGIQSAPALARVAAALVTGQDLPDDVLAAGVTRAALSRGRAGLVD